jgi:hypothetical protein
MSYHARSTKKPAHHTLDDDDLFGVKKNKIQKNYSRKYMFVYVFYFICLAGYPSRLMQ